MEEILFFTLTILSISLLLNLINLTDYLMAKRRERKTFTQSYFIPEFKSDSPESVKPLTNKCICCLNND